MKTGTRHVAALFVDARGCYAGIEGVDVWDEKRDARLYPGPWPVVAHPPCQRWGKFWAGSPLAIARTGRRKTKGDDGGCFASALASVRKWGGVLEHPAGSAAWPTFGIPLPPRGGGWQRTVCGGWTCQVEQGRYGHYARKPTLLYAFGVKPAPMRWGVTCEPRFPQWAIDKHGIEWCRRAGELAFQGGGVDSACRIGTPIEFRDVLIEMARSVRQEAMAS